MNLFIPGGFSYLRNQNNQNSNWKKLLGFRNMQEKVRKFLCLLSCSKWALLCILFLYILPYSRKSCRINRVFLLINFEIKSVILTISKIIHALIFSNHLLRLKLDLDLKEYLMEHPVGSKQSQNLHQCTFVTLRFHQKEF